MTTRLLVILLTLAPILAFADDQEITIKAKIKQLVELRLATIEAPSDEKRLASNEQFLKFLRDALAHKNSFKTSFDTIPQMADLRSGDKYFRMLNWNVPMDDGTQRYYCFVQHYDRKAKEYKVIEFDRGYRDIEGEDRKVFSDHDWYGALYYKIVTAKMKRNSRKRTYMVLGWDGHNEFSTIKFVDVMVITPKGIRFGEDIFNIPGKKNVRRMILQYKSDATVTLRYDEKSKQIIFNELVPMQPDLEGLPEFYIPLLEFDALEWKKRKWSWVDEVDARMNDKGRIYVDPPSEQNIR